ncbi:hypothetical protein CRUP_001406, partial [Coryphaenoides rupestris]
MREERCSFGVGTWAGGGRWAGTCRRAQLRGARSRPVAEGRQWKGKFLHHYENYGATANDIADWLK